MSSPLSTLGHLHIPQLLNAEMKTFNIVPKNYTFHINTVFIEVLNYFSDFGINQFVSGSYLT